MTFKDHFSGHADDYARYRPSYPDTLFNYLATLAPHTETAWDCGTGNGQAAHRLAAHFARVIATDASADQIARATPHARIEFLAVPAEQTSIAPASIDLITVAQALHWFDLTRFYAECARVLRPRGILAAWCYGLCRVEPEIDSMLDRFYHETVGPFWPPERRYIDDGYTSLDFPYEAMSVPAFHMEAHWRLDELLGYLRTWSACRRYQSRHATDPVTRLADDLLEHWDDAARARRVRWPLHLLVGRAP